MKLLAGIAVRIHEGTVDIFWYLPPISGRSMSGTDFASSRGKGKATILRVGDCPVIEATCKGKKSLSKKTTGIEREITLIHGSGENPELVTAGHITFRGFGQ
jgi:hypothetical protein